MTGGLPKDGPATTQLRNPTLWLALALAALTLLVYAQVATFGFAWDDALYVTRNSRTLAGLNRGSLAWAFTCFEDGSFLPLVWLSHAACVSLFGTNAGGHHLANVALHIGNTLLLFFLLRRLTGELGPSAAVAALFALHPLHVESVAWVSARKDVLSTFFWLLTLWSYASYTRKPDRKGYLATALLFLLGLLSKSMLVTLPLTLILMDFWPLRRLRPAPIPALLRQAWPLLLEKIPLLVFSLLAGLTTIWAQQRAGAVSAPGDLGFPDRVANAFLAVIKYIQLLLVPTGLSPFYPHPGAGYSPGLLAVAVLVVGAATALGVLQARKRPHLLFGWLWFLITLLPVAGLIQVGAQAYADRYTYVPLIGLFIMLAWSVAEALERVTVPRIARITAGAGLLGAMVSLTAIQTAQWKDNETLFTQALTLDPNNELAIENYGVFLGSEGLFPEAIAALTKAVSINPKAYLFHYNLGDVLERSGQPARAVASFREAARLAPHFILASHRLGHLLVMEGKFQEAALPVTRTLSVPPTSLHADPGIQRVVRQVSLVDQGMIFRDKGQFTDSIRCFQESLALAPDFAWARLQLGLSLREQGREDDARVQIRKALDLEPSSNLFRYHLGKGLLKARRFSETKAMFEDILKRDPESALGRRGLEELQHASRDSAMPSREPVQPVR